MKVNKKLLDIFKTSHATSDEYTYPCSYINDNIPTKSNIIETTTSGNIKCYKFPDGTMVASGYASNITIPGNSVYSQYFNLPVAFKDTDFVVIPSIRNTGAFWTWIVLSGKIANSSKIQIDAVDNDANAASCSIQFIAIGKWK